MKLLSALTFILCVLTIAHADAQTVYLADTALVTDVGYGGAPASCKTNGMTYNAVPMDKNRGIWVADVFTVPAGATWVFDTVIVYGYQYGSSLSSPFTACNLLIYDGAPGLGGNVIWGDTSANVLMSTSFTGIYKVDTFSADGALMETTRPIMYLKLYLPLPPRLSAGTYWLSWSATCATTSSPANTPYKVLPGRVNPKGQMSRVYVNGSWVYVVDNVDTVGLNKIIKAKAGLDVYTLNGSAGNVLLQNAPNPVSGATVISYSVNEAGTVKLTVYNRLGQLVATLAEGRVDEGEHHVTFDASNLPCGTYYYQLKTATGVSVMQMVVVR